MYACVVKNNQETWDVFTVFTDIPDQKKERIDAALASELPIVGRNLTEYGSSVRSGAIWDGTNFNGGDPTSITEGSIRGQYSYVCNNMIILTIIGQPNTQKNEQLVSIFESETTLIKVPDGQTAKVGDIWNGTDIISI